MTAARDFQLLRSGVAGVQVVAADSVHAFGRHTHDEFGIGLIERGAQKSASGRGVVEAGAGDMITVNPGEVHDGKPVDAAGRRWRMLYVDPARMLDAATDISPGSPSSSLEFKAPVIRDAALAAQLSRLFDAATDRDSVLLPFEVALLSLTARLLQPLPRERIALVCGVARVRERIDDDPSADLTLADMATAAGLSRYQFLRAFTRLAGLPPHAYLLQRRVQRVRALLRNGMGLADAAAACGFADQSHMTRCFVRSFGLTPGAWARSASCTFTPARHS